MPRDNENEARNVLPCAKVRHIRRPLSLFAFIYAVDQGLMGINYPKRINFAFRCTKMYL